MVSWARRALAAYWAAYQARRHGQQDLELALDLLKEIWVWTKYKDARWAVNTEKLLRRCGRIP